MGRGRVASTVSGGRRRGRRWRGRPSRLEESFPHGGASAHAAPGPWCWRRAARARVGPRLTRGKRPHSRSPGVWCTPVSRVSRGHRSSEAPAYSRVPPSASPPAGQPNRPSWGSRTIRVHGQHSMNTYRSRPPADPHPPFKPLPEGAGVSALLRQAPEMTLPPLAAGSCATPPGHGPAARIAAHRCSGWACPGGRWYRRGVPTAGPLWSPGA